MPVGIYLYEIDESFGPNVLAEYYLAQENKINKEILKDFEEKHVQKEFSNTIFSMLILLRQFAFASSRVLAFTNFTYI